MIEKGEAGLTGSLARHRQYVYRHYGMHVRSEVRLPTAVEQPEISGACDVVIRVQDSGVAPIPEGDAVASLPCPEHGTDMIEYRGPRGIWIWLHSLGTFHIAQDRTRVDVYPGKQSDEQTIGLALGGPVLLFLRHLRGRPSLHASAIATERGAVAFVGEQGQGKTTMAASFLRYGATIITDDALPLSEGVDGVYGEPGPPFMKVWSPTVRHTLRLSDNLPHLTPSLEKRLLALDGRFSISQQAARLHVIYALDRYDPTVRGTAKVSFRSLGRREALLSLLANTSCRPYLLPVEQAACFPLYSRLLRHTSVRVLSYPHGFESQDVVCKSVLQDVAEH